LHAGQVVAKDDDPAATMTAAGSVSGASGGGAARGATGGEGEESEEARVQRGAVDDEATEVEWTPSASFIQTSSEQMKSQLLAAGGGAGSDTAEP
jgi:hypothetical protein